MTPTPTQPPAPEEQRTCRRCGEPLRGRYIRGDGSCLEAPACDRRAIDRILARLEALEAALAASERQREYDRDREIERANPDDW